MTLSLGLSQWENETLKKIPPWGALLFPSSLPVQLRMTVGNILYNEKSIYSDFFLFSLMGWENIATVLFHFPVSYYSLASMGQQKTKPERRPG
jgi:hypothetical protein